MQPQLEYVVNKSKATLLQAPPYEKGRDDTFLAIELWPCPNA
jgi:hypothetical protein